jgi:U3 small nucleolar RNA-associated protein 21
MSPPIATAESSRAPKRTKLEVQQKKSQPRLFAPFRALGFITNHVPFALQVRQAKGALEGPNVTIVTSLGNSWAMWDAGKMRLLFVGRY